MTADAVAALAADDVTLTFGSVAALTGVTFDVQPGELFAIIGPNGAGKTSMFNLLSRIYNPTSGQLWLFGADMAKLRPHQLAGHGVARTFQNLGLFKVRTVLDNILIGRTHLLTSGPVRGGLATPGTRKEEAANREAALEALRFVGLEDAANRPVGILPYGVQKRVEIARALAMEPRLLLLDEPVAGMSQGERSEIGDLIAHIHSTRQLAIVVVEHDMGLVMRLAQRVLVLDFGRSIALGTPAEVQANPEVVRAYLGEVDEEQAS